ncbi:MAG: hypothetical protein AB7V46_07450 [Thermomicrobiales bacterium]
MSRSDKTSVDDAPARKENGRARRPYAGKLMREGELSRAAKLRAAAILEVLGGQRTPTDAAQALSISLPRYYLLEQQALEGLVKACEPRHRGPRVSSQKQLARLEQEIDKLQRDCARQQALLRVAQRSVGLSPPAPVPVEKKVAGRRRPRRPTVRALRAAAALQSDAMPAVSSSGSSHATRAS